MIDRLIARRDLLVLAAIIGLAAILRLPGLDTRGQWDADQGNEMLVLLHMVRDGQVPLLGPPTFAGTFHHGALYYYLLAPAALISDADPGAVTLEIAVLGIATVAAVWGLGRALAGSWAGHVAGLLAAVSPAGVLGSTFIWNPNVVPLGAAIALLGAVRAWRTRRAAWWLVGALGTMLTMQTHVSGGLLLPPLLLAFALDAARRPRGSRRATLVAGLAGLGILAAGYLPLLAHELATGFADSRGLIGYLGSGSVAGGGLVERTLIVALRSVAWPFAGVITEAPIAAAATGLIAAGLFAAAVRWAPQADRPGAWLLLGTFVWSLPALALTAPTLTTSIPGLPNDHYHTFLDPLVIALVAAGIAGLGRIARRPGQDSAGGAHEAGAASRTGSPDGSAAPRARAVPPAVIGPGLGMAAMIVLVAVSVGRWPPAAAPDGGWHLADEAAVRVIEQGIGSGIGLFSIPDAKAPDSLRFPLERRGVVPEQRGGPGRPGTASAVVVCDPLFDDLLGAPCGGPAEDRWLAGHGAPVLRLADRFEAGLRRVISVYVDGSP